MSILTKHKQPLLLFIENTQVLKCTDGKNTAQKQNSNTQMNTICGRTINIGHYQYLHNLHIPDRSLVLLIKLVPEGIADCPLGTMQSILDLRALCVCVCDILAEIRYKIYDCEQQQRSIQFCNTTFSTKISRRES